MRESIFKFILLPVFYILCTHSAFADYTPVYSDGHGCVNMDSQFVGTVRTDKDAQGNYSKGYATITIPQGACPEILTFASYEHSGTLLPYENQKLYDSISAWYGPGTHEIGPLKIACNFQTDLYFGSVVTTWPSQGAIAIPGPGVGGSIYIAANAVEHQQCNHTPPPPPPCTTNCNPCPYCNYHPPQQQPPSTCTYCNNNGGYNNYNNYNYGYKHNWRKTSYVPQYMQYTQNEPCYYCNSNYQESGNYFGGGYSQPMTYANSTAASFAYAGSGGAYAGSSQYQQNPNPYYNYIQPYVQPWMNYGGWNQNLQQNQSNYSW